MLTAFALHVAALLAAPLSQPLLPPPPPSLVIVAAHAIPGAVVFDLDRGAQVTVAIDDDGVVTSVVADLATTASPSASPTARADATALPSHLQRIDLTADGARVIIRGDGRAVAVPLAPA